MVDGRESEIVVEDILSDGGEMLDDEDRIRFRRKMWRICAGREITTSMFA